MVDEKELDMIEKAHRAAERLEQANKVHEELLKKQEAFEARQIISGRAEAGTREHQLSEKEKIAIDTKNYFKGTELEGALK